MLFDDDLMESSKTVAISSWTEPYRGGAVKVLWQFLVDNLQPAGQAWRIGQMGERIPTTDPYAHYVSIVQSSGMGKSRAVDELAKTHFVIPINIRVAQSNGFPPSDPNVRFFLCNWSCEQHEIRNKCRAFLQALFEITADVLSGVKYRGKYPKAGENREYFTFDRRPDDTAEDIAAKFREHMSDGMTFGSQGVKRKYFFQAVLDKAEELLGLRRGVSHEIIAQKFVRLVQTIHGDAHDGSIHANEGPKVVIMFDEAHTMTTPMTDDSLGTSYTTFTELLQCLHVHRNLSLFTLFLSVTGRIGQLVSSRPGERSSPTIHPGNYSINRPFTTLGFDHLAIKLKFNGSDNLSDIVSDNHIAHYGRPMWGAMMNSQERNSSLTKKEIISFAAMKLICMQISCDPLDIEQKLACLSQRLPIGFKCPTYKALEQQLRQIEAHMRVCSKAGPGFESLVTASPSEPILSEAAYYLMEITNMDLASSFLKILGQFSLDQGDRGELIVLLMFTIARDKAVGPPAPFSPKTRWCFVADLLSQLFKCRQVVLEAKGQVVTSNSQDSCILDEDLQSTFRDSKVYFSHFIKIHESGCLGVNYLMKLLARGAGVLCANNFSGIDAVIPVLFEGTRLAVENVSAILLRITNNSMYGAESDSFLFEQMDPYDTGIFNEDHDMPIIRIVFALAADEPSLEIVHVSKSISGRKYTTYDIWTAGLSPTVFDVITASNVDVWAELLEATYDWKDVFTGASPEELALRKMLVPGLAQQANLLG
ncbi:hypothetical protein BDN70DRAFT_870313 [Pholiota conissans]|uniref:Uncharacterized protein n=1 Tax=Pholiota conissans TaxID=109636 RepID=A0A9P5ZF12_9AGAR|nr:hypothetical protein BDN70DRAFT_870313 [Pholiota conissans]